VLYNILSLLVLQEKQRIMGDEDFKGKQGAINQPTTGRYATT